MKYKRILLKLSGESLQGGQKYGLSPEMLQSYAEQIKAAAATGVQIGIVIGGGNIFRGLTGAKKGFDRVKGDQMGMLATVINSLALQGAAVDLATDPAWLAEGLTDFGFDRSLYTFARDGFAPFREEYKAACVNLGRRVTFDLPEGGQGLSLIHI